MKAHLNKVSFWTFLLGIVFAGTPKSVEAHCQIPCGIYDDHSRVMTLLEDVATIRKSAKQIEALKGKADAQSINQIVRWVNNKELHAEKVISTIADYFLTQRVKPSQKDYAERLQKHHSVILAAMKAKQNADIKFAEALKVAIEAIKPYYPKHEHK